uniref:DNA-binding protein n=1 Tax=Pseudomonas phage Cygsa01 TaxID=3138529 RepID=A0AAU6W4C9_9VIRU
MAKATNSAQILNKIGCPHLTLHRGYGYYYFSFDDESRKLYETESVMCCHLNQMELDTWVSDGKAFVEKMERQYTEQKELAEALALSRHTPKS